ncbi:MAG: hypothetical protein WC467_01915 [Patescibacteria group bacterium]
MKDTEIQGTSICVIEKWIAVIEGYIESKNLYVKVGSPDLGVLACSNFTEEKDNKKLLFLQKDVVFLLIMLSKVFPDIFQKFNNTGSCPFFVIKRELRMKNECSKSIAKKVSIAKAIIALSK